MPHLAPLPPNSGGQSFKVLQFWGILGAIESQPFNQTTYSGVRADAVRSFVLFW
jgi:hypothetical protein